MGGACDPDPSGYARDLYSREFAPEPTEAGLEGDVIEPDTAEGAGDDPAADVESGDGGFIVSSPTFTHDEDGNAYDENGNHVGEWDEDEQEIVFFDKGEDGGSSGSGTGGSSSDTTTAGSGRDTTGRGLDRDTTRGGSVNDTASGGSGDDTTSGGAGNDDLGLVWLLKLRPASRRAPERRGKGDTV